MLAAGVIFDWDPASLILLDRDNPREVTLLTVARIALIPSILTCQLSSFVEEGNVVVVSNCIHVYSQCRRTEM